MFKLFSPLFGFFSSLLVVSRHGDWSRELGLYLMRENGHSLRAAAAAVGIKRAPTAGMAIKRFQARLATAKAVRKALEQVKKEMG